MEVAIRRPTPADVEPCGRIIYAAFRGIAERHGFPPDFPDAETAVQLAGHFIGHPSIYGVVAEDNGRVVGSNFLDERDSIRGLGPITVDPQTQRRGVGRRLMQALLDRGKDSRGVRLLQDAFNTLSMSLYTSLGFNTTDPIAFLRGSPKSQPPANFEVRPMEEKDLAACAELCRRIHGHERTSELSDNIAVFSPFVAAREGRIVAYALVAFWGHGVAETEQDMRALLLGVAAATAEPLSFLLPTRQSDLFRWCLAEGLRVVKPMTYMVTGEHQPPRGCWFPSILY